MEFQQTPLQGLYVIELDKIADDRGFFARSFCTQEFLKAGLPTNFPQCNVSHNLVRGTIRGMHYQSVPYQEAKLVRCTHGEVFDVVADLRPESETFGQTFSSNLSAENWRMLFIPKGFAHGFQTVTDRAEVFYQMSDLYQPGYASGIRFDDPALDISWPLEVSNISNADLALPSFVEYQQCAPKNQGSEQ